HPMRTLGIIAAAVAALSATAASAQAPAAPFNQTVNRQIQPQAERLLLGLIRSGRSLSMDGVAVFNGSDKFLPGKIALGLTDFIADLPKEDPRRAEYVR